ncbi:tetratricopeptide repeat protein, partial [bacterium]
MNGAERAARVAALRAAGRYSEAVDAAAAALADDSAEAWRRGLGYEERRRLPAGDPAAEWRAFDALRRRRPTEAAAHALAGLSAHAAGRWDEGRAAFARAGRLGPAHALWARAWGAKLRCWQAESFLGAGRTEAGLAAFADAVRASGGASWARAWAAQAELWCGRPERAEKALKAALKGAGDWSLGPRSWAVGWLALARLASGDARAAERSFAEALKGDPGDAEALAGAAEAAWRLGRRSPALALAKLLAETCPGSPWSGVIETLAGRDPVGAWARLRAAD